MASDADSTELEVTWLNDDSDYQRCFVCGQNNPCGLQARFHNEGASIVTEFIGDERHQGFPGVIHGGVLASLLDETLGRVSLLERRWTMTARLELRYRAPAPIGVPLRIVANALDSRHGMVRAHGVVVPAAAPDQIICEAEGSFLPLPPDVREQAVRDWPGLEKFFTP